MDTLRISYRSQMRLYADRPDILTWGRWYRCPPGAIAAPASAFYSAQWNKGYPQDSPLGEVYRERPPYSKRPADPRLTGRHYCGTTAWTQGIAYADRPGLATDITGMPLCCQALPPAPGGVAIGGRGIWGPIGIVSQVGSACGCGTASGATT